MTAFAASSSGGTTSSQARPNGVVNWKLIFENPFATASAVSGIRWSTLARTIVTFMPVSTCAGRSAITLSIPARVSAKLPGASVAGRAEHAPVGALVRDVHDELARVACRDLHVEGGARLGDVARGTARRIEGGTMLEERAVLQVEALRRDETQRRALLVERRAED